MNVDQIQIEILPDGTIKTTTDEIGSANHQNAEQFVAMMSRLLGGTTAIVRRREAHTHGHEHGHQHA